MKRLLILFTVALFLCTVIAHGGEHKGKSVRAHSLCDLMSNWKKYNRHTVRIRAIYKDTGAQAWLYDPACSNGEGLADVNFQRQTKSTMKKLDQIIAKDGQAWVVLEGVFYGPEPFDYIDPKLPAQIREALEKSHKRYGHLGAYDIKINVLKIINISEVNSQH
jgi:hypothetical protein